MARIVERGDFIQTLNEPRRIWPLQIEHDFSTFKGGYIPHLYFILRDGALTIRWTRKGRTDNWRIGG